MAAWHACVQHGLLLSCQVWSVVKERAAQKSLVLQFAGWIALRMAAMHAVAMQVKERAVQKANWPGRGGPKVRPVAHPQAVGRE